jgi:hypothetical protein
LRRRGRVSSSCLRDCRVLLPRIEPFPYYERVRAGLVRHSRRRECVWLVCVRWHVHMCRGVLLRCRKHDHGGCTVHRGKLLHWRQFAAVVLQCCR